MPGTLTCQPLLYGWKTDAGHACTAPSDLTPRMYFESYKKQMNKLPFKGSVGFLHQCPKEENTANPSSPSYANLVHKVIFLCILNVIFIL